MSDFYKKICFSFWINHKFEPQTLFSEDAE